MLHKLTFIVTNEHFYVTKYLFTVITVIIFLKNFFIIFKIITVKSQKHITIKISGFSVNILDS
jgi:hypothetical protein